MLLIPKMNYKKLTLQFILFLSLTAYGATQLAYAIDSRQRVYNLDNPDELVLYEMARNEIGQEVVISPSPTSTITTKKDWIAKRPLKGVLAGKEDYFRTCFDTDTKAKFAIAIIGQESGYGTSKLARENNNFYGIYKGGWVKFDSVEDGICGSKKYIGKYIRDFATSDLSKESYTKAMKGYCTSGCETHSNIYTIFKSL